MSDDAGIIFKELHKCVLMSEGNTCLKTYGRIGSGYHSQVHFFPAQKVKECMPSQTCGQITILHILPCVSQTFQVWSWNFLPVQGTLAVLKWILFLVFAKPFVSRFLKHMTVQQCLAHTHHFSPRNTCTYSLNQTIVCAFKK